MWPWSEAAESTLEGGHTAVARVDVLHAGAKVYELEVVSGQVSSDADRAIRANMAATLVDPTGDLTRGDVEDLLDPYECEIAPHRGVIVSTSTQVTLYAANAGFGAQGFGNTGFGGVDVAGVAVSTLHTPELAPLGVFGLTARRVSDGDDGLTIALTGQDRAMNYQVPLSDTLAIPAGTPVEEAVIALLSRANPGISILTMDTGYTCGPLIFDPEIDVWGEAQELAESVGARLFHDRTGQCVLAPIGPPGRYPVAAFREGGGLLLSLGRAEDSDTIRNVVVATSPDGLIKAVVADDDPSSPTYAGGRYGWRPTTVDNQHFSSVRQAEQAAAARLIYELGRSETVTFNAVPNPGLDVDDIVIVHRPRAGLVRRGLVVATVDMPLAADEPMTVGCRKSVLAQDGTVLADMPEYEITATSSEGLLPAGIGFGLQEFGTSAFGGN